jgi:hypothetical protein
VTRGKDGMELIYGRYEPDEVVWRTVGGRRIFIHSRRGGAGRGHGGQRKVSVCEKRLDYRHWQ